jgi:hypothetical protein
VLGIPSKFFSQDQAERILGSLGLDAAGIVATVRRTW